MNVNWPYNKSKDIPTWVECKKDKLFWYSVCHYIKRTTNVVFSSSSLLPWNDLKNFWVLFAKYEIGFIVSFIEVWQQPIFAYNCTYWYKYMYPSNTTYKFIYTHIFKTQNLNYTRSLNVKLLKGKPAFFHIMFSSKCYIVCWADTTCQTNDSVIRIAQKYL